VPLPVCSTGLRLALPAPNLCLTASQCQGPLRFSTNREAPGFSSNRSRFPQLDAFALLDCPVRQKLAHVPDLERCLRNSRAKRKSIEDPSCSSSTACTGKTKGFSEHLEHIWSAQSPCTSASYGLRQSSVLESIVPLPGSFSPCRSVTSTRIPQPFSNSLCNTGWTVFCDPAEPRRVLAPSSPRSTCPASPDVRDFLPKK
jgi:hypothetical protein